MRFNLNSGYGRILMEQIASAVGPVIGRIFIVVSASDNSIVRDMMREIVVPDPAGQVRFFETLEAAYEAVTSNANDVIVLAGHSTHTVADGIAWTKSRVNVIGMDGGDRLVQQGAKVELSGNVATAYVVKVTGVRNSFRNIKFIQSSTNAAALNVVQAAGEGTLYKNCSFVFGVASNLDETTSSELLLGEDSGTFINCSFGTDVLLTSAARAVITLDAITGGNADGAKSNRFIDCEAVIMSSTANALLVKLADTAGAKFLNEFINLRLVAVINATNSAVAITNAIASASSFVEGSLVFIRPTTANCTNGCAGVTDKVVISGAPAFSNNAYEGGTPA
jgi:hypothetical protein